MPPDAGLAGRPDRLDLELAGWLLDSLSRERALLPEDQVGLAIQALQRASEKRLFPRERNLTTRDFRHSTLLAVDALAKMLPACRDRLYPSIRALFRDFCEFTEWAIGLANDRINRVSLPPREKRVLDLWLYFRELGLRRDWKQFYRAAQSAHATLGLPDEKGDRLQSLSLHRHLSKDQAGGVFVGRDGRVLMGKRQMRDRLASELGIKRRRRGGDSREPLTVPLDHEPAAKTTSVDLDAVEAVRALEDLRPWIEERVRAEPTGSVRRTVLESFGALLLGQLTVRELARRSGRARSALQRALNDESAAFQSMKNSRRR